MGRRLKNNCCYLQQVDGPGRTEAQAVDVDGELQGIVAVGGLVHAPGEEKQGQTRMSPERVASLDDVTSGHCITSRLMTSLSVVPDRLPF